MGCLVLVALTNAGCSREPKCHGEADSDELYRMQKLVNQGHEPCPMHLAPKIVVDERGIELNGRKVAGRQALPVDGEPRRISALFSELKHNRETWKSVHPGRSFQPIVEIAISPDTDFVGGASTIVSTAYAGYPTMTVRSGGVVFEMGYDVPKPPSDEAAPPADLYIERRADGRYDVRFQRGNTPGRSALELELDSVPSWVDQMCLPTEPCAGAISLRVRGEFVITATLIQRLQRTRSFSQRPPWIRFHDEPPR